jgi:peptidyl-prolyl cis-trans isomerase B (cyclophilin B)
VPGYKERQRKLARERYQRRVARDAVRRRRHRLLTVSGTAGVIVLALVAAGAVLLVTRPAATAAAEPAQHCAYTKSGTAARKVKLPTASPDYTAAYTATLKTTQGTVVIDLLNSKATCTVNSFVSLADQKYFNNTPCHRLTTASGLYVLQCGDPTGTGEGGPGYKFDDENLKGAKYTSGTVAMANSGANTNGSQFFLVYQKSSLPASYTPFGTIVKGLNVIRTIAKAGSNNANGQGDGAPNDKVEIESVTVKKT